MRPAILCFALLLPFTPAFFACSAGNPPFPDPKQQPYRLAPVFEFDHPQQMVCVDLDGDGRDEIVQWEPGGFSEPANIHLRTQDFETIDQVNFSGRLLNPHWLDYNKDGILEILVPYVRNDSLFVSFVNARGQKLFYFFLIDGKPRVEDGGTIPWDPGIHRFYLVDRGNDGRRALVTVLNTTYARMPRGLVMHSLPDGRLLAQKMVGGFIKQTFMGDFNGDGRLEIIAQTGSPNNGAEAGGFDDRHAYLIVFDLPTLEVSWSREMGGLWTQLDLFHEDFDGDGRDEFLAFTWSHVPQAKEVRLELIEPGTWYIQRRLSLPEPLTGPQVIDLDHDARPEILASKAPDEIWVFNHRLKVVKRHRLEVRGDLSVLPDVDGDGISEIIWGSSEGSLLLGPDLRGKAVFSGGSVNGIKLRGSGISPYLIGIRNDRDIILELAKNRFYLFHRYGPYMLWVIGIGAVMGAVLAGFSLWHRNRLLQVIQELAIDTQERGLLLLDPHQRIRMTNTAFRRWFGFEGEESIQQARFDQALAAFPRLVSFLREVLISPAHHHEGILLLDLNGIPHRLQVVADPISSGRKDAPYWLVCLEDQSPQADLQQARAWTMMARRVAHDIKNPLTSILLTLQQLQMAYREEAPEKATGFDSYVGRITERIEHLRRMTRNFMKFVNIEQPNRVLTDLNAFVQEVSAAINQGLPSDIQLQLQLSPDLPGARLDREQIQSVLENLVANAVNALPDGGRVTITTSLAQNLLLSSPETGSVTPASPQDYLVLEVRDTGVGIPAAEQERLFEPGFSTVERGTGLGLTLVKKIVEDHGGHIEVEGEEGVGAVFCIYLPAEVGG